MVDGIVPEKKEEGEVKGEEGGVLCVGGGHAVAGTDVIYERSIQSTFILHARLRRFLPVGLASFISLLRTKLSPSQPICPANMSRISISRVAHISET